MANQRQLRNLIFNLGVVTAALAIAFLLIVVATPTQAQTFKVIHNFSGGQDGATPFAGVTLDKAGNLYGTARLGGIGYGTVFELKPKNSSFVFNLLYSFTSGGDEGDPRARVVFGPNGTLFGTTLGPSGTVFNLRPFPSVCRAALCPWMENTLFNFDNGEGGGLPVLGDLLFDQAGNIYGTTYSGGGNGDGVVYELAPPNSWNTENVLYAFSGSDGAGPYNGVIFDKAGNLYGTTLTGGLGNGGTVFELMQSVGFPWPQCTLNNFRNGSDGGNLYAGLIFDQSGNLYGATSNGGTGGGGTVFELTPSAPCTWSLKTLYSFTGSSGCGPWGTLVMDGAGNLYGTTKCDGANNAGNVFELTYPNWTYTSLYDFMGGNDGANPISNVSVATDGSGTLYGTASTGGTQNVGVVWEITFP